MEVENLDATADQKHFIRLSHDGTDWEYINKGHIAKVTSSFQEDFKDTHPQYEHQNKCIINIYMDNGEVISFDAQSVSNQITWNTGTQAALEVAKVDLTKWSL